MAGNDNESLKRLLATFRVEADEHLGAIASGLHALKDDPARAESVNIVETVFREVHSLKGAARVVNFATVESLCRSLEGVFSALKKGRLDVSAALVGLLLEAVDRLAHLLADEAAASPAPPPAITALMRRLDQATSGSSPATSPDPPASPHTSGQTPAPGPAPVTLGPDIDTVRVSAARLDAVLRQAEELIAPRLAASQRTAELRDGATVLAHWKKARARIQPALRTIGRSTARSPGIDGMARHSDELPTVLEYLEEEQRFMSDLENRLAKLSKTAARDQRTLTGMSDRLLQDVKEMQLLPLASLHDVLQRLVRDLSREQGKQVVLVLQGGDIQLDRRLLNGLKDPLIHLLRNAIDHGIEPAAARAHAGKPSQGAITISASQRDGGKIELRVADDGIGIDRERVEVAARRLGLLPVEVGNGGNASDALGLIFHSGVSTSPIVTDVSGRGLGLAIVREKVERLGGSVSIESHPGQGAAFELVLPTSMATMRGVLMRVGEQLCVIPSAGVERVARVAAGEVRTVENRETVVLDGDLIALSALSTALGIPRSPSAASATHIPLVVLKDKHARIAFGVDEIVGEQEILVKGLGPQLARVRNVAGASMLGTGRLVPVLNVPDLLQSAVAISTAIGAAGPTVPSSATHPAGGRKASILVAEDSITSRSLLRSILESAGYAVTTAVDGMDAYATLKSADFDLVVSDVEMPRMDGFDLTARVRADKALADLPVVLVTALESREHRERGIDVGANAYIMKSSFDQSNLLEIVGRLI